MKLAQAIFLLIVGQATSISAGPIYDPFLENFQVGAFSKPANIGLINGWPASLHQPVLTDEEWLAGAEQVLAVGENNLTQKFVRMLATSESEAESNLDGARQALADLKAHRIGSEFIRFLRFERLAVAHSDMTLPAKYQIQIAQQIVDQAQEFTLDARQLWAWRMRATTQPALSQWPSLAKMGSFDVNNAWAVWAVMRKNAGLPLFDPDVSSEELGGVVSRVRKGWFKPEELASSPLEPDWQSGVGAILLSSSDLGAHFKAFSNPPANFSKQGWWVRGQRRFLQGRAASYEILAARADLKPAWQMDVWRRASELRILRGAWVEGLADLTAALELAKAKHGTKSLRKRLRQWVEQALVLALAKDDLAVARTLVKMGREHFVGDDLTAFETDISQWEDRLSREDLVMTPASDDSVDRARYEVLIGAAPEVRPVTAGERAAFVEAADRDLWGLWYSWGLSLADTSVVTGERPQKASLYRQALIRGLAAPQGTAQIDSALAIVALRFADRNWRHHLVHQLIDVETGQISGWRTPPRPSLVPMLLPEVRGSELDRHALLGFCLATGDMRGILGLAFELPGKGLTRDEKRLFLYPLPAPGPIREALLAAENDPALLLAIARNESLFEPAVRSWAGALGWMQIMPFHYPNLGANFGPENWRIPAMSVGRGDGLVSENRRRYDGDPYRILAAYNAGPKAASRWDQQLGGEAERDIYLAWIGYPETRDYVEKVLVDREIYRGIIEKKSE